MLGALSLRNGVLYVARHDAAARVRPYDLDGTPLADGFEFHAAPRASRVAIGGIDVDPDHHVWIADAASSRLRCFSLFGREVRGLATPDEVAQDAKGSLFGLTDVEVEERDGGLQLLTACGGWRRHAVQVFDDQGALVNALRSEGDPQASFHGARRATRREERIYVCETHAARVQVFRNGEFEFLFRLPYGVEGRLEPTALAALSDGRMIVACAGPASALILVDRAGRALRTLAESGSTAGQVDEPEDLVVHEGADDGRTRVAVVDQGGDRVQVFTLEGRCAGALAGLPGRAR